VNGAVRRWGCHLDLRWSTDGPDWPVRGGQCAAKESFVNRIAREEDEYIDGWSHGRKRPNHVLKKKPRVIGGPFEFDSL
jgi:hypothetical protein